MTTNKTNANMCSRMSSHRNSDKGPCYHVIKTNPYVQQNVPLHLHLKVFQ